MLLPLHVLVFENKPKRSFLQCTQVYEHYVFVETRLIYNMLYLARPKGGLVITRHNKLRKLTAEILGEVCKNVVIERLRTPLTGKNFPNLQIRATKQE